MRVKGAVGRFFSGVLLSRITGFGRDLSMAFAFGDHPSVAAFLVAFRLANLLRRIVAEGPFQSAFIPYFESAKVEHSESYALFFFRKLTHVLSFSLVVLIVLINIFLFSVSDLFEESNREIIELTAYLFPSLLFISLYGLNSALLQCYDSFFIPQIAPALCNLIWIVTALSIRGFEVKEAMPLLAIGVVIGFIFQWAITFVLTRRYVKKEVRIDGEKPWKMPKETFWLFRSFALGAIGIGAVQINSLLDSLFARYIDPRAPTYLWFSIRIEQLLLALLGLACVTTIVPKLTRAIKEGRLSQAEEFFSSSLQKISLVMIPATFGLFALGEPLLNLLYGRGSFSSFAILETSRSLMGYAVGLFPTTLVILFSSLYYAQGDFKTPTRFSLYSVGVNILLNTLFTFLGGKAAVIAFATSISSWINFFLLLRSSLLRLSFVRLEGVFGRESISLLLLSCTALFFTSLGSLALGMNEELSRSLGGQLQKLIILSFIFSGTLLFLSWVFRQRGLILLVKELFMK